MTDTEQTPTIGDAVRIYHRDRSPETGEVTRTLQPGEYVIVRENRHGDWTVRCPRGTTHDVLRADAEPVAVADEANQPEWLAKLPRYRVTEGRYAGQVARGWDSPYRGKIAVWLEQGHPYTRPDGRIGSALVYSPDRLERLG